MEKYFKNIRKILNSIDIMLLVHMVSIIFSWQKQYNFLKANLISKCLI